MSSLLNEFSSSHLPFVSWLVSDLFLLETLPNKHPCRNEDTTHIYPTTACTQESAFIWPLPSAPLVRIFHSPQSEDKILESTSPVPVGVQLTSDQGSTECLWVSARHLTNSFRMFLYMRQRKVPGEQLILPDDLAQKMQIKQNTNSKGGPRWPTSPVPGSLPTSPRFGFILGPLGDTP